MRPTLMMTQMWVVQEEVVAGTIDPQRLLEQLIKAMPVVMEIRAASAVLVAAAVLVLLVLMVLVGVRVRNKVEQVGTGLLPT